MKSDLGKDIALFYRELPGTKEELEAAKRYFPNCYRQRAYTKPGELVLARYSVLPNYLETEKDINILGGTLLNSYRQHRWVAEFEYYEQLAPFTFRSWTNIANCEHLGPFVVKGKTNSKKWRWETHMYAATKRDAAKIAAELRLDGHIGDQDIVYREYVPLKHTEVDPVCGIPYANEYRFFFFGKKMIEAGYYWDIAEGADKKASSMGQVWKEASDACRLAEQVAAVASQYTNFFVLDIAEKAEAAGGGWVLVEVNDGQCSGLSTISPDSFYRNLKEELETWQK